jgi:homoserine O-acetyltransferase/O-succinyltransferase
MISHKTFVHLDAIERRARQDVVQPDDVLAWYRVRDQFQSYMLHQGKKFVRNASMRTPTCASSTCGRATTPPRRATRRPRRSLRPRAARRPEVAGVLDRLGFLLLSRGTGGTRETPGKAKVDVMHITAHSDKGHDSFLLEPDLYTPHITWLLFNGKTPQACQHSADDIVGDFAFFDLLQREGLDMAVSHADMHLAAVALGRRMAVGPAVRARP